ncbi:MAG TPA: metallophosphoesterase [Casimicrobiaceae bacterium]|nr:metallophosphoesterase [Casimicrobiaceae bacterium]
MKRVRRLAIAGLVLLVGACAAPSALAPGEDAIRAAFVVQGDGGMSVARVITGDPSCPAVDVDGVALPMTIRAVPATLPLRPTENRPAAAKPSAFPVLVCERRLPAGAERASVGGHTLPLLHREARRIVILGDTGCAMQGAAGALQACDDGTAWPFAQIAAAAANKRPDLVIHVGDYLYRENGCPDGNPKCAGSPWGYGWDAWNADFFAPARALLSAAPWVFVRGNHESCARAGQGWWRFLDPRPLVAGRDCNDSGNDLAGDFSEPYAVPLSADVQLIVFDSSRAGVTPLAADDPVFSIYSGELERAFELARGTAHNFFVDHHPILGFATDVSRQPPGVYPGNAALQSVLAAQNGLALFPSGIDATIAGHDHLFEAVGFTTAHPAQLIAGNGGTRLDQPLPRPLPPGATPARGAIVATVTSTTAFGFVTLERTARAAWRIDAWDRRGHLMTSCQLDQRKIACRPQALP